MRIIIAVVLALTLAACGGLKPGAVTINERLPAMDYNSISNQYSERLTEVAIQGVVGGEDVLTVWMDAFRPGTAYSQKVMFPKDKVDSFVSMIDKYLEWAAMAKERGDMLDKEIGSEFAQAGMRNKLSIYSGSVDAHLLVIKPCTPFGCGDAQPQYYDEEGAKELRDLLIRFSNNQLKITDDSVYQ